MDQIFDLSKWEAELASGSADAHTTPDANQVRVIVTEETTCTETAVGVEDTASGTGSSSSDTDREADLSQAFDAASELDTNVENNSRTSTIESANATAPEKTNTNQSCPAPNGYQDIFSLESDAQCLIHSADFYDFDLQAVLVFFSFFVALFLKCFKSKQNDYFMNKALTFLLVALFFKWLALSIIYTADKRGETISLFGAFVPWQ